MNARRTLKIGLALALTAPLAAQEPEGLGPEELNPFAPTEASDPQQEMIRLFQQVETNMDQMGGLLLDASKGDVSKLTDLAASGIEDLLQNAPRRPQGSASSALSELLHATEAQGGSVLKDIDRILEIAAEQGGT